MAVKIVTDSTSDIPQEVARELDITVVPLNVRFGQESFLDGVEISSEVFFQRLAAAESLPATSQPSPGVFLEVYQRLLSQGHQVVSIHISEHLSGTLNSARQAKEEMGDAAVEIIDSLQASMGLGLVVTAAAQAVRGGASYQEAVQAARGAMGEVQVFAVLDTLEYLQKGGRVGKVRALVGSLLRMRPIITVREGIVHSLSIARSRAQGVQYLITVAEERAPLKQAAVVFSTTSQEADELVERLRPLVTGGRVMRARFGPVLGTYVGPGSWGMALQSEKKDALS
ncbi:MAG: DegV family protein [Chloroflexi bacterium]|nr:DegV family protein [Chloroflexota bacterium]